MGEIVVNSKDHKLYIIEKVEDGKCKARKLREEDIAKLSNAEQQLVRSYQLQAQAMPELAMDAEKAAAMCDKLDKMSREWAHEQKQWIMQGWGYKPKLNPAAKTAFRSPLYWFRIRSFCVRSPYG